MILHCSDSFEPFTGLLNKDQWIVELEPAQPRFELYEDKEIQLHNKYIYIYFTFKPKYFLPYTKNERNIGS